MIEEILRLLIEAQRDVAINAMAYPDASSYERWVGKHQGLQTALNIISDVLKGAEED